MKRTTAQRGYDHHHQALRQAALAAFQPGQPCARCMRPLHNWPHQRNNRGAYTCRHCDLGHIDGTGKQAYAGLEHARCNRSAGASLRIMRLMQARQPVEGQRIMPAPPRRRPSRDW